MIPKEIVSMILAYEDEMDVFWDENCLNYEPSKKIRREKIENLIKKQIGLINQFKKEVCEKQRIKVAEAHGYKEGTIGYENIVNGVPEPN